MSESKTEQSKRRPMAGIECPEENDVPMGRGGFVNSHVGHRRYIKMVQDRQMEYVQCKKVDKMEIAWDIVRRLRALEPPARFLRKDPATGLWNDVGDQKFREKVSQALREHQPFIKGISEWDEADLEPLPVGEAVEVGRSWNENKPEQQSQTSNCQRPAVLVSADKRRAFLATRNEGTVATDDTLFLPPDDARFNLSEFSVSHGPSFPEFESESSIRRNSSGLGNLLEILQSDVIDNLDTLNDSNECLSVADEGNCYCKNDRIEIGNRRSFMENRVMLEEPLPAISKRVLPFPDQVSEGDFTYPPFKRCNRSRANSEVSRKLDEINWMIPPFDVPLESDGNGQGMEF